MKFSKIRDVKSPQRANETDAGIDFYVPENTLSFKKDLIKINKDIDLSINEEAFWLRAHSRVLIPSGVHVNVPEGHALIAFNKSGVASKKGLDLMASVVDVGYQGEVHISVCNTNKVDIPIKFGEKIIQFILLPVNFSMPDEIDYKNLYKEKSNRGPNGFGSTDK